MPEGPDADGADVIHDAVSQVVKGFMPGISESSAGRFPSPHSTTTATSTTSQPGYFGLPCALIFYFFLFIFQLS